MSERENLVFSILLHKLWRESFGNDPFEAFGSFSLFLGLFLSCCCWVGLLVGFVKEESWEEGKKKKKKKLSVVGCVCVCGFFV